jgi:hypothetical protein
VRGRRLSACPRSCPLRTALAHAAASSTAHACVADAVATAFAHVSKPSTLLRALRPWDADVQCRMRVVLEFALRNERCRRDRLEAVSVQAVESAAAAAPPQVRSVFLLCVCGRRLQCFLQHTRARSAAQAARAGDRTRSSSKRASGAAVDGTCTCTALCSDACINRALNMECGADNCTAKGCTNRGRFDSASTLRTRVENVRDRAVVPSCRRAVVPSCRRAAVYVRVCVCARLLRALWSRVVAVAVVR